MIQSIRKITTKKGDMMAMLKIEDPFGKVDAVMFPNSYKKYFEVLQDDGLIFVEGVLEKRMGEMQVIINQADSITLEELQKKAKKEKLWTDNEKIEQITRQDLEEEEIAEAEEVLEVKESEVKDISKSSDDDQVYSILINREVNKEFFIKLKELLGKHPGKKKVQLIIGDKVVPAPITVSVTGELENEVEELLKS